MMMMASMCSPSVIMRVPALSVLLLLPLSLPPGPPEEEEEEEWGASPVVGVGAGVGCPRWGCPPIPPPPIPTGGPWAPVEDAGEEGSGISERP